MHATAATAFFFRFVRRIAKIPVCPVGVLFHLWCSYVGPATCKVMGQVLPLGMQKSGPSASPVVGSRAEGHFIAVGATQVTGQKAVLSEHVSEAICIPSASREPGHTFSLEAQWRGQKLATAASPGTPAPLPPPPLSRALS